MKDKFFVYQPDGDGCSEFVAFDGAFGESILDEAECVKMLNGFNSTCDANQALITKQSEQLKMLRSALEAVVKVNHTHGGSLGSSGSFYYKVSENVFKLCDKALEATKPVEE